MVLPYPLGSWKYPFYVHFVALLTRFLEVLIDCMTYRMYRFVVAWKVLHATFSFESHDWQTGTTFVVALLYHEISVVLVIFKY
jgi:hypothetical protein